MKKAFIGIICSALIILVAYGAEQIRDEGTKRYVQHEEEPAYTQCETDDKDVLCTNLPIVEIDTDGEKIPGRKYIDEKTGRVRMELGPNGEDEITARIRVVDKEEGNNHSDDKPALKSRIRIQVRGNSSRYYDKSNYMINLIEKDGSNRNEKVMGMDKHHEWVLHGPYLDKTLMRNYMWYNIGGEIMDYAPNVRFCEVIINGKYKGVYVMTESVTAGKNGARINASVDRKDQTYSGYILRLDRGSDTEIKNIRTFTDYTYKSTAKKNIVYPGTSNLTPEIAESIAQDFSSFEKMLYSYDYDDNTSGFKQHIDMESFIDYFIINEFSQNSDAGWLSTYIYKDRDGLYRMCIWDFNSACDAYVDPTDIRGFKMKDRLWFKMMMRDEVFVNQLIDRYKELRKGILSEEYLYSFIDDTRAYLGDAVERNYEVWGYSFGKKYDLLTPTERNPRSYDEAIEIMKKHIHDRGEWMDRNIDSLRQYSAHSKVKFYQEDAN